MGVDGFGMGLMLEAGMIASHIGSYVGENRFARKACNRRPIGPYSDSAGHTRRADSRRRCWDSAFYVPAGVGTVVAEGKEVREFGGKPYLMERGLHADVSLIKAGKRTVMAILSTEKQLVISIPQWPQPRI